MGTAARRMAPGLVAGLCLGLLALGPGLRSGFLLSYDMVFVPREPFAAALPGLAPPRAVPSDLVVAALSRALPGDIVQKLVLLAVFVLSCAGAAALLESLGFESLLPRLACGVFYAWNPFVGERLIIGQWALLLGYAGLPWVLRAVIGQDGQGRAGWRWAGRLVLSLVPAVIGGFAAMVITALVVVPAVLVSRQDRAQRTAIAMATLAVGSLPWLIPSLLHPVYADPAGVAAFAARADTPFGGFGSLLMLGGAWNAQTVPTGYGGAWSVLWLLVVVAGLVGFAGGFLRDRRRWAGLGVAALAGLLIACIGLTGIGRDLLRSAMTAWPGFAILRDGQQFVAPLALAEAAGFGAAAAWARQGAQGRVDAAGLALGMVALLAPVLLLPGLAWGAAGRLRPAAYPHGWLAAARMIDASPAPGDVLLLPWQTYRRPSWNHGEVVLDPWTRLLARPVIWNDGTRVGDVELAPDEPLARRLDGAIDGGGTLTAALRAAGVRFVVDDADGPGQPVGARLPGAAVVVSQPGLIVYLLPG